MEETNNKNDFFQKVARARGRVFAGLGYALGATVVGGAIYLSGVQRGVSMGYEQKTQEVEQARIQEEANSSSISNMVKIVSLLQGNVEIYDRNGLQAIIAREEIKLTNRSPFNADGQYQCVVVNDMTHNYDDGN